MIADYKKEDTVLSLFLTEKKNDGICRYLQGVTMAEKGVSSLVTVRVGDYIKEEQDGVS